MVLICDVDMVASPNIIANLNTEMPNDSATATDQAAISDTHYWRRHAQLTRNHSGKKMK